jgi:hypothetical protein
MSLKSFSGLTPFNTIKGLILKYTALHEGSKLLLMLIAPGFPHLNSPGFLRVILARVDCRCVLRGSHRLVMSVTLNNVLGFRFSPSARTCCKI